jgi:hypothetical protein
VGGNRDPSSEPEGQALTSEPRTGAEVGVDEWVARSAERREAERGWRGRLGRQAARVGWWPRLAIVAFLGLLFPFLGANDFQLQVGINALLLAMLALGLNIAVG